MLRRILIAVVCCAVLFLLGVFFVVLSTAAMDGKTARASEDLAFLAHELSGAGVEVGDGLPDIERFVKANTALASRVSYLLSDPRLKAVGKGPSAGVVPERRLILVYEGTSHSVYVYSDGSRVFERKRQRLLGL